MYMGQAINNVRNVHWYLWRQGYLYHQTRSQGDGQVETRDPKRLEIPARDPMSTVDWGWLLRHSPSGLVSDRARGTSTTFLFFQGGKGAHGDCHFCSQ